MKFEVSNWFKKLKCPKMSIQTKYFLIAIILIGSIGIWLPILLGIALKQGFQKDELPINLTTFYVSIYFGGCVDSILKLLDGGKKSSRKSEVLNLIGLILISILLVVATVWLKIDGYFNIPMLLSLVGTVIALRLWWNNNVDNPLFLDIREVREDEQNEIMDSLN